MIGLIQREEVDFGLFPITNKLKDAPGFFSSVFITSEMVILSYAAKVNDISVDMFWTFRRISSYFWILVFLCMLVLIFFPLCFGKLPKRIRFQVFFVYLRSCLNKPHFEPKGKHYAFCRMSSITLLYNLLLFLLLGCLVNTNLVINSKPFLFANEANLVQKPEIKVIFIKNHWTVDLFREEDSHKDRGIIWKNALRHQSNPFFNTNEKGISFVRMGIALRNYAMILLSIHAVTFKRIMCDAHADTITTDMIFISPSLESNLMSILYRRNIQKPKRRLFDKK